MFFHRTVSILKVKCFRSELLTYFVSEMTKSIFTRTKNIRILFEYTLKDFLKYLWCSAYNHVTIAGKFTIYDKSKYNQKHHKSHVDIN